MEFGSRKDDKGEPEEGEVEFELAPTIIEADKTYNCK